LVPTRQQLITGVLPAQSSTSSSGAFLLSIGPTNGTGNVTLNYDIFLNGLGNGTITSLQLLQAGGITPLLTLNNVTVVNNRIVGSTQIPASLAQQILASPCSFSLGLNGAILTNGSLIAPLAASNEVFLAVVGSAQGANGSNFKTDVSIFNNSALGVTTSSANTFVQFFPTGAGDDDAP